ncbi:peptidoglycan-binding domain-containing protein [Aerosakkonema sp. BLCC-F183]|uniref:peptidoglycan-binding domain-containing protein n=1 Tax=Aerosakkonema sp. BLCC-F183 TaxID=3342834 RepID=UPI0035B97966
MDSKEIQKHLIRLGLLDPPADGKWGKYSEQALNDFKKIYFIQESDLAEAAIPWSLGSDFASRIIKYMLQNKYFIAIGANRFNIVYVEGVDGDGKLNPDRPNEFNDRRLVIEIISGIPRIVGSWEATTEPGYHYTNNPMNPKGAARIVFGQYKAWRVGIHGNSEPHEALVQAAPIKVHRDANRDMMRTGDAIEEGLFAVNQHWGYDYPRTNISLASAGCLVGRTRNGHREFMRLIKQDNRYQINNSYLFFTTIIAGDKL